MTAIVVVDDEFLLVDVLSFALEDEGYEVTRAYHGKMALDSIKLLQLRPALVISDFMMPLMTGLELARVLKSDPELESIPFILVSGAQGPQARDHDNLFTAVFEKPYSLPDLLAKVRELVGPPG